MMFSSPIAGVAYLMRGFRMLTEPGLRAFVLVPLLINTVIFIGAIYLLVTNFTAWVDALIALWLPDWGWLDFLIYFLWPLFALVLVLMVYYGFSVVANFIAAPFNGLLSERVEQRLRGVAINSEQSLLKVIPGTLAREVAKLAYFLPRVFVLLLIGFIPVVNLAAPLLWFLFSAWMMAIQYIDYPMDNNHVSFKQMKRLLSARRWSAMGFGSLIQIGLLIPVINLILMPAAVIGATVFWVEEYDEKTKRQLIQTAS